MWRWRADADLVTEVSHTRRVMPLLMRGRNECAVYFSQEIDPSAGETFLKQFREQSGTHATWTHLLLFAFCRTLHQWPRLNRFTAGGRIWSRRGIWASFSAKKQKTNDSPIAVVKRRLDPEWSFAELVEALSTELRVARSDALSQSDRELRLLFRLPLFFQKTAVGALRLADRLGLLPRAMVDGDPMFASVFLANLGSIAMEPATHHLYEYGNIPLFVVAGAIRDCPVVHEGKTVVAPRLPLRFTFDERVEDGLYCASALRTFQEILEDPSQFDRTPISA